MREFSCFGAVCAALSPFPRLSPIPYGTFNFLCTSGFALKLKTQFRKSHTALDVCLHAHACVGEGDFCVVTKDDLSSFYGKCVSVCVDACVCCPCACLSD